LVLYTILVFFGVLWWLHQKTPKCIFLVSRHHFSVLWCTLVTTPPQDTKMHIFGVVHHFSVLWCTFVTTPKDTKVHIFGV
jgi:hypothetical protein